MGNFSNNVRLIQLFIYSIHFEQCTRHRWSSDSLY